MDETTLYERILELQAPWFVEAVDFDEADCVVNVSVGVDSDTALSCPECGLKVPRYDHRNRRWRHLDTCQYPTYVWCDVPRVECPDHGCLTINVPWAEERSRFTLLFETWVIDWLKESSILAVSRQFELSWNAVDGIMRRAVARGLSRRRRRVARRIGVDEVSFKKGHRYVTVVTDDQGRVIDVEDGRTKDSLRRFYDTLTVRQKSALEAISMDMSGAYIAVTLEEIPDAQNKIAFDKFHVAKMINDSVDQVGKQERRALYRLLKEEELIGHRFLWLRNSAHLNREQRRTLHRLQRVANKTGRAWMLKEYAMSLWDYQTRGWAERAWMKWYGRAMRSRLMPMKIAATSIKKNLWGIVNAIVLNADNAMAESVNSKIKIAKVRSRGFRNQERFKSAILFHHGGLDLYPDPP